NGPLAKSDQIEFYGKINDGVPDSALYVNSRQQPHPYYSLYSDTSSYFLTWRKDQIPGKRIISEYGTAENQTAHCHLREELRLLIAHYPAGNIYPLGAGYDNGTILTTYDTG